MFNVSLATLPSITKGNTIVTRYDSRDMVLDTHLRRRWTQIFGELTGDLYICRFHATDIVAWDDKTVYLDHGNYMTVTTKGRMNQVSQQFDLKYHVNQQAFDWYISTWKAGETIADAVKVAMPFRYAVIDRSTQKRIV
tara:strand:- start:1344 stop:1757 length:414 start_codon:yes stop_codon:yes gene_type:complete